MSNKKKNELIELGNVYSEKPNFQSGKSGYAAGRVYDADGLATAVTALGGGMGAKTGLYAVKQIGKRKDSNSGTQPFQQDRVYDADGISPALQSGLPEGAHKLKTGTRIRRLTPIECERLQGYKDGHTAIGLNEKGEEVKISDSQRYKVLGNSVTVNVIEAIITKLIKVNGL